MGRFPITKNDKCASRRALGHKLSALLWFAFVLLGSREIAAGTFSLLTYNVAGNGTTDWSTNSQQIQAIGREVAFIQPDVITFQEIPYTNTYQMVNFVNLYLPGFRMATNSGTDGFLRSVIVSRHPIVRSEKWLDGANLTNFGVNARFARDLFEAEIDVPGFANPVHIFTTHLKSSSDAESAARRGAEASAISNFFVNSFLPTRGDRAYVLTGDLNEDVNRPPSNSHGPLQRLVGNETGLNLTTPTNQYTGNDVTFSIRGTLSKRYDYILPCQLLYTNIAHSGVFRTSVLNPLPQGLFSGDDKSASDHLPVLMTFTVPASDSFSVTGLSYNQGLVNLKWEAMPGSHYAVETSTNLLFWSPLVSDIEASNTVSGWNGTVDDPLRFLRIRRL